MKRTLQAILTVAALYVATALAAFQWRNPTANEWAALRHFVDAMKWETLPKFQP